MNNDDIVLPPLPKEWSEYCGDERVDEDTCFLSIAEAKAYGHQCRLAALEEAAKACDSERVEEIAEGDTTYNLALRHAIDAIRALNATLDSEE
jgi:hypothetical protein